MDYSGCLLFDYDATSKIYDVLTEHVGLLHVLPITVHLRFFAGQVGGTTLSLSYSLRFIVGPLLHDYEILVSAQGPLVFGFRVWGLRVWGQGLTIFKYTQPVQWHWFKYLNPSSRPCRIFNPSKGSAMSWFSWKNNWRWLMFFCKKWEQVITIFLGNK